ncbi:hypothetical protein R3P38DRAFT_2763892 [Favolaschia claudopus]|uniref:Ubiquitin-like domain-containing protein n=1 Tax=Favolaschia claudopus TaxID=2862362 RepID=A0AAW0DH80_9AGAR
MVVAHPLEHSEPFHVNPSFSELDDLPDISFVSTVKIYVQYLEDTDNVNTVVQYNVDLLQSVRKLKTDIEEIEGIPAEMQKELQDLRFNGCILMDDHTLQSYLVQEQSIVYLKKLVLLEAHLCSFGGVPRAKRSSLFLPAVPSHWYQHAAPYTALRDWDGDMKHASTNGLRLERGTNVTVFDDDAVPVVLPAFTFPLAQHRRFKLRLGEKGHSYVDLALRYERTAPPGEATPIDVRLNCVSAGDRKITSVSLKIIAPGLNVTEIKSPDMTTLGTLNSVVVESTTHQTRNYHGGINITIPQTPLGIDASVARETQHTHKEEGIRESALTVTGVVHNVDTAHWIVEGRRGVGEREGVPKVLEGMSFVLQEKPSEFQYECFVTTTKGGREVEHWGQSVGIIGKLKQAWPGEQASVHEQTESPVRLETTRCGIRAVYSRFTRFLRH